MSGSSFSPLTANDGTNLVALLQEMRAGGVIRPACQRR